MWSALEGHSRLAWVCVAVRAGSVEELVTNAYDVVDSSGINQRNHKKIIRKHVADEIIASRV